MEENGAFRQPTTVLKSRENPAIKRYSKLVSSRRERDESSLFVIEGVRLCTEALDWDVGMETAFITEACRHKHPALFERLERLSIQLYYIDDRLAGKLSDTRTPQGIFCICRKPDHSPDVDMILRKRCWILLAGIQDPGNLGTMLRTAEALGIDGVILSNHCCDLYGPKTVRATMGALFRLPVLETANGASFLASLGDRAVTYAAVVDPTAESSSEAAKAAHSDDRPTIVCIGNEGNGLPQELIDACDRRITIRMKGRAESLNAAMAAGILMWEFCS